MIDHRSADRERRLLQACIAIAALVPIAAGGAGVALGPRLLDLVSAPAAADSHFRYLAGLLLALGLAFWGTIPGIERNAARFRLLAAIVISGGLARALSLVLAGTPTAPMLGALAMELGVTPILALWQARVARRSALLEPRSGSGIRTQPARSVGACGSGTRPYADMPRQVPVTSRRCRTTSPPCRPYRSGRHTH